MSGDLKKMMSKLKEDKKKKEEVAIDPDSDPASLIEGEGDEDPEKPATKDPEKPATASKTETTETPVETAQEEDAETEIAVLQNDGIFRRELLLALRELTDVFKVNTQALLDLKELVEVALNGKK